MSELETTLNALFSYKSPSDIYAMFTGDLDKQIWIRAPGQGRQLARERSAIHDFFLKRWSEERLMTASTHEAWALVAHGGYGRRELAPNSDIDIMLLVENIIASENPLVAAYEEAVASFKEFYGFSLKAGINNFANVRSLTAKDVNSFIDLRYLAGNEELASRFRNQVREQHESHELFFHNLSLWEKARQTQTRDLDDISSFNIKSGRGGLRNFQTGIWMKCLPEFLNSSAIYEQLEHDDPAALESLDILLAVRSWLNLQKEGKRLHYLRTHWRELDESGANVVHTDTFQREDFTELGEYWREKLLTARRTVERFTSGIIAKELRDGVPLGKFLHTMHGLYWPQDHVEEDTETRSRTFFALMQQVQRRGIPIDRAQYQSTLRDITNWIRPQQGFVDLFYEQGSLATSLQTLAGLGILEKMIPHFTQLETAIPPVNHRSPHLTSAGFARQKIAVLEQLVGEETPRPYLAGEYGALSADHAAALKLALLVKRIPTLSDEFPGVIKNTPHEYCTMLARILPFSQETLSLAEFLLTNHDLLTNAAKSSLNDDCTVRRLMKSLKSKDCLRALVLFTYADHGKIEQIAQQGHLWQSIDELHHKIMNKYTGRGEDMQYDPHALDFEETLMADDLGPDFLTSLYAPHASTWIPHLVHVAYTHEPIIRPVRDPPVWGIACPDYGGLMAVITGEHYEMGLNVQQAYAYVLSQHQLALSFFGLAAGSTPPKEYASSLASAITERRYIDLDPEQILLPLTSRRAHLERTEGLDLYRLCFKTNADTKGILYALTRILHERLDASIYGIKAHVAKGSVDDYIFFKTPYSFSEARECVERHIIVAD